MTAPTSDTTILDALHALVALAESVTADPEQVTYGPPLNTELDFVAIGYTGNADEPAVTFDFEVADAALGRDGEVYDVAGLVSCWRGDSTFADVDALAFDLLRRLRAGIAADRKLGGVVALTRLTSGALVHDVEDEGAVASIPFVIHVEAWSR